jgi:hypothetical protein
MLRADPVPIEMLQDPEEVTGRAAEPMAMLSEPPPDSIALSPMATLPLPAPVGYAPDPRAVLLELVNAKTPPIVVGVAFARSRVPEVVIVVEQSPVPAATDVTVPWHWVMVFHFNPEVQAESAVRT